MEIDTLNLTKVVVEYQYEFILLISFFDISSDYEELKFNKLCNCVRDCYIKIGHKRFWKSISHNAITVYWI